VRFASLAGTYTQEQLRDGFNQTVTLTTTNYGKTKTYVVNNYGDRAPEGFYKITEFLSQLRDSKFRCHAVATNSMITVHDLLSALNTHIHCRAPKNGTKSACKLAMRMLLSIEYSWRTKSRFCAR
jgi:hypothetical protein